MSLRDRIDRLDVSLFDEIPSGGTTTADRRSLLAVHAALAARGDFRYLEIGSWLGASLQSFIVDPRCRSIVSIDRRDAVSADERPVLPAYPDNTTARMLECLSRVPGADESKLTTIDASTDELTPADLSADLCFIDAEHTDAAALRDARFCRKVLRDRGVIVFHDRTLVDRGLRLFLSELRSYCAYPLSHNLLVVELGVPSLLSDARVKRQLPRKIWLVAGRLGGTRPALSLAARARRLEAACARTALTIAAPRGSRRPGHIDQSVSAKPSFEIYTFANDAQLYGGMLDSFTAAGFSPNALVRLGDCDEDPYAAITRIGRHSAARYPILCHQDVRLDRGAGLAELSAVLEKLDMVDPLWVVAGTAGCTPDGRMLVCADPRGQPTTDPSLLLHPVVTLDEHFLVFNRRNAPSCSARLSGFHFYGSDVCLRALVSGGTSYVIDFPISHLSHGNQRIGFDALRDRFIGIWSEQFLFCYLATTVGVLFISRSRLLRRLFGSTLAVARIEHAIRTSDMRTKPTRMG